MRKTFSLPILLFATLFFVFFLNAASAQQPVPEEKKRAMHKLDPIDIFPQVQERGDRERSRDKRTPNNQSSNIVANESESSASGKTSRRNARRKNDLPETSTAELAGNVAPSPTPDSVSESVSAFANTAPPVSPVSAGESANPVAASSQTLAAMNTSPLPSNGATAKDQALPLPIILALLVLVLVMLIFVFTKLIRYLRNPVS